MTIDCVKRGSDLLDVMAPGWFLRVDTSILDMCSSRFCVLGQLFGLYDSGLAFLDIGHFSAGYYGFCLSSVFRGSWQELADEWVMVIQKKGNGDV